MDAAGKTALAWLSLVDAANYKESWQVASPNFKARITPLHWEQAIRSVRSPLGTLAIRSFQDATTSTSLPGAPDGNYEVIRFQNRFDKKESAIETVVADFGKDGFWHVTGYFIK